MNKKHTFDTPLPKTDPRQYSRAPLGTWPGIPSDPLRAKFIAPAERDRLGAILSEYHDADAVRAENDYVSARTEVLRLERNPVDVPRAEILRRKADAMDVEAFSLANQTMDECDRKARTACAAIMERVGGELWKLAEAECAKRESTLREYGVPLMEIENNDSNPIEIYTIWKDEVVMGLAYQAWAASDYWPSEMRGETAYSFTAGIELATQIVA